MHDAGGYLEQRNRSPVSLGAAVAINGALIGALLFSSPIVIKELPGIISLIDPIEVKPPPAPPPSQKAEPRPRQRETVSAVRPPVASDDPPERTRTADYVPPQPIDPPGAGIVRQDPPPHVPVLTGVRPDPRFAGALQPAYPAALQRRGIEGMVEVRVLIGADGRVKAIEPISATAPGFFDATREQALKRWRFLPATRDGIAIEAWRTMTVRFRLDGTQ